VLPIRVRIVAGLLTAAVPLAGCAEFDNPAAAQGLTRSDLVAQIAGQLGGSASSTYAATYQLAGGRTATIAQAQNPARSAYRYPGGQMLVTPAATTQCMRKICTMISPPTPTTPPPAALFANAEKAGLAVPAAVQSLLSAARLDQDMIVDQHDTTVAGRHATCLNLRNVDKAETGAFSTCITSDGVVGTFTGTLSGTRIDIALTDYADRAPRNAFTPPAAATMLDRRPH
jgi:hypothetical protein